MLIREKEDLPSDLLDRAVKHHSGAKDSKLRDLIKDDNRPTLLVFVRQFACAGCSQRMTELLINLEILHSSGVDVIVVGCGSVEDACDLYDRMALESRPITVVTDPSLAVHRAAGLTRTLFGVLGPKATVNLVRAMASGHRNGWGKGDFFQLGGTILLDAERKVVAVHVERNLGETMPIGDVVDRALALLGERALTGIP